MQDLPSLVAVCGIYFPDQDRTWAPCIRAQSLSYWTPRDVLTVAVFLKHSPVLPSETHHLLIFLLIPGFLLCHYFC